MEPVQPFVVSSRIGKTRNNITCNGLTVETQVEAAQPDPTLAGHLTFALKHEGVHLEFLAGLFEVVPVEVMAQWTRREPSGQYARRAGFFYEWLTGHTLDFPGVSVGNYVLALPDTEYFTSTSPVNVPRWRVRNNLPGTAAYYPLVRRTAAVRARRI